MSSRGSSDTWIAGACAAVSIDLFVYPLDTLKTRLQAPDYAQRYLYPVTGQLNRAALYRGLYQGVGSVALATIPSSGAFFTTYETFKRAFDALDIVPRPIGHAAASSIAEAVSCAILAPAEVLKQNAQMISSSGSGANKSSTMTVFRRFRKQPLTLWRGYSALLVRNLPSTGIQFPIFEAVKKHLTARYGYEDIGNATASQRFGISAASAATSGSIAAFLTTPIDVVKTRMMLVDGDDSKEQGPKESKSRKTRFNVHSYLRQIYLNQGIRGLFRGGLLRSSWTAVGSGLYLSTYDVVKHMLENRHSKHD